MSAFERSGWLEGLRSMRNDLSLRIAGAMRFSRGIHIETACGELRSIGPDQLPRVAALSRRYSVRFEDSLNEATSLNNYAYLELLDRAWRQANREPPSGLIQSDIGCGNFWYVAALHSFFRPKTLIGYEVDAFRRYLNGHTRQDFALGYARHYPGTQYRAVDYLAVQEEADLITLWFPFLSRHAILAWGLPLKLLNPRMLFIRIAANLAPGGALLMVNHGCEEARIARELCEAAGMRERWRWIELEPLRSRPQPPVISYWQR